MRKSKLYLSVLASAAMIMSSSVVTMAAETDSTDTDAAVATEETTTSETPETEAPETEAPETEAPETEAPETEAPETEAPETEAPETEAPETEAPETEAPEAEAPETEAPETEAPETEAPETEAPAEEGGVIYENEAGQKVSSEELGSWKWNAEAGKWQFVLDGTEDYLGGGIWEIDGTPYAFDKDGYMVTGWYTDEWGDRYYFNSNGARRTGWLQDGSAWYYLEPNPVEDSWRYINGEKYYFGADGKMVTGWYFDAYTDENGTVTGGDWYYLNSDGSMYDDGWLKQGDTYYYLAPGSGYMYKNGTYNIDGIDRLFDNSGRLLAGQWYFDAYKNANGVVTGGYWYYLKADGTRYKGWLKEGNTWYYLDEHSGMMYKNGTYDIDGKTYLFNDSGHLTSGWYFAPSRNPDTGVITGGSWYYAKADGTIYEGWLYQGGKWYYLWEDSGRMVSDTVTYIEENNEYFGFNASGVMQTGWYFDAHKDYETGEVYDGEWYYFNGSGYRQYGWIWDGAWYYLDEDYGYMYKDMFNVGIDGTRYSFNNSGVMLKGWQFNSYYDGDGNVVGGDWYYYNASGAMQKGWIWDGAWYYLDKTSGRMYKGDGFFIDGKTYLFNNSGKMLTGDQWDEDAQTWLFFNSDGSGLTGWRWANDADGVGHWYYYEDAMMYRNGTYYVAEDGRYAFFDEDGVWTGYSPEPAEPAVNE